MHFFRTSIIQKKKNQCSKGQLNFGLQKIPPCLLSSTKSKYCLKIKPKWNLGKTFRECIGVIND